MFIWNQRFCENYEFYINYLKEEDTTYHLIWIENLFRRGNITLRIP